MLGKSGLKSFAVGISYDLNWSSDIIQLSELRVSVKNEAMDMKQELVYEFIFHLKGKKFHTPFILFSALSSKNE